MPCGSLIAGVRSVPIFSLGHASKTTLEGVAHDHYWFDAHGGLDRRSVDHLRRAAAVSTAVATPASSHATDAAAATTETERLVEIQKGSASRAAVRNQPTTTAARTGTAAGPDAARTDATEPTATADTATDAAGHAADAARCAAGAATCAGSARSAADDDGTAGHGFELRAELFRRRSLPSKRHTNDDEPTGRVACDPHEHAIPQRKQLTVDHRLSRRLDGNGR